ncbi:MAG: 2'-5' RNA ligase family protein [Actinomycetota bacterium]
MARCFVSLRPPSHVVEAVAAECRGEQRGLRWSRPADHHVTLRFFADVDPGQLIEAVGAVEHEPVDVRGGPALLEIFEGVVALPITGADPLAGSVLDATGHLASFERPFRGHLTVGRLAAPAVGTFVPRPCVVAWRAESLLVVESRPVAGRHDHITLAELPLSTGAG